MIQFIQETKPDIIAIVETHLKGREEIQINGYEWIGENFKEAIRGSRGVGFLIKNGIKFKIVQHERVLIEEGRSIGIEIGAT